MGFQESLDIACRSRKTHGFDKKDCRERGGDPANSPLEKRWKREGEREEEGNKSEERRREFMFRTHGNLWAAN